MGWRKEDGSAANTGDMLDSMDTLTAFLSGLRASLINAGFDQPAAEMICVQHHAAMMQAGLCAMHDRQEG